MALDERQQQIKEGAGLEESRLNVEFIDWLRRWSTPLLVVVAVVVLGYVGYERWQLSTRAEVDRAFTQLDAMTQGASPSPESLKALADEFNGIRGVAHLARLKAADLNLQAARRGVRVGADLGQDGAPADVADLLTDEQRAAVLAEAESLYTRVLGDADGDEATASHAIGAAFGLAAVAECRSDQVAAVAMYRRAQELANAADLKALAATAAERIESLDELQMPKLYAAAELPKLPWADEEPLRLPLEDSGLVNPTPTPVDPSAPPGTEPTTPAQAPPGAAPPPQPENTPPAAPPTEPKPEPAPTPPPPAP
jgi:hypothetical protein